MRIFALIFSLIVVGCSSGGTNTESDQRCPSGAAACSKVLNSSLTRIDPVERFETRLRTLKETLADKKNPQEVVKAFTNPAVRQALLQMQAVLKVYEKSAMDTSDVKKLSEFRGEIKDLESELGFYTRYLELYDRVKDTRMTAEQLSFISDKAAYIAKEFEAYLRKNDWLPDPVEKINSLIKKMRKVNFSKKSVDQRMQYEAMIEMIDEVRAGLKGREIYFNKFRYTEQDLDLGLHTLRRQLRWIVLSFQGADGLFYFSALDPKDKSIQKLESLYGKSKYMELSPPQKGAIYLDKALVLRMINLVTALGGLKDFKESQLDLAQAMIEAGSFTDMNKAQAFALARMREKFGNLTVEETSKGLYKYYLETDPLKQLKKDIESQIN